MEITEEFCDCRPSSKDRRHICLMCSKEIKKDLDIESMTIAELKPMLKRIYARYAVIRDEAVRG